MLMPSRLSRRSRTGCRLGSQVRRRRRSRLRGIPGSRNGTPKYAIGWHAATRIRSSTSSSSARRSPGSRGRRRTTSQSSAIAQTSPKSSLAELRTWWPESRPRGRTSGFSSPGRSSNGGASIRRLCSSEGDQVRPPRRSVLRRVLAEVDSFRKTNRVRKAVGDLERVRRTFDTVPRTGTLVGYVDLPGFRARAVARRDPCEGTPRLQAASGASPSSDPGSISPTRAKGTTSTPSRRSSHSQ